MIFCCSAEENINDGIHIHKKSVHVYENNQYAIRGVRIPPPSPPKKKERKKNANRFLPIHVLGSFSGVPPEAADENHSV